MILFLVAGKCVPTREAFLAAWLVARVLDREVDFPSVFNHRGLLSKRFVAVVALMKLEVGVDRPTVVFQVFHRPKLFGAQGAHVGPVFHVAGANVTVFLQVGGLEECFEAAAAF